MKKISPNDTIIFSSFKLIKIEDERKSILIDL